MARGAAARDPTPSARRALGRVRVPHVGSGVAGEAARQLRDHGVEIGEVARDAEGSRVGLRVERAARPGARRDRRRAPRGTAPRRPPAGAPRIGPALEPRGRPPRTRRARPEGTHRARAGRPRRGSTRCEAASRGRRSAGLGASGGRPAFPTAPPDPSRSAPRCGRLGFPVAARTRGEGGLDDAGHGFARVGREGHEHLADLPRVGDRLRREVLEPLLDEQHREDVSRRSRCSSRSRPCSAGRRRSRACGRTRPSARDRGRAG